MKKLCTILIALAATTALLANGVDINGIHYILAGDSAKVTYTGSSYLDPSTYPNAITIPSSVTYNQQVFRVTSIGHYAFYDCHNLTSITIPSSIRDIGNYAFYLCTSLMTISIPNSVKSIGNKAFAVCSSLNSLTLPNGLEEIGARSFEECTSLTYVTIPSSLKRVGSDAFAMSFNDTHLTAVYISDLTAWCNISFEGYYSNPVLFANHLYLNGQELAELVWPDSITRVGKYAFMGCESLESVVLHNDVTILDDYAFHGCANLDTINIPNSLTIIGEEALRSCNITSIILPTTVTSIGKCAFVNCSRLTSINIPEGITRLEEGIFTSCSNLTSIIIPSGVNSIGLGAFYNCCNLASITLKCQRPPAVGTSAFDNVYRDIPVYVPCGTITKYQSANVWNTFSNIVETTYYPYVITVQSADSTKGIAIVEKNGNCDSAAVISATSKEHCHFTQWSDGNTDTIRAMVLTQDLSLIAYFAIDQHTITTIGTNGVVTGSGTYDYGSTITLAATANEHYHFTGWSDGISTATRSITVTEDKTYTANFAIDQFTITASGVNGTITGTGTYDYGSTITLTATPNEHYHFVRWSDGSTSASRQVQVTQNVSFTAEFAIDQHTITTVGTNGVVTGSGAYDYGSTITLTATANEHYHFVGWADGISTATRSITVTEDKTYTANFAIDQFTITASGINGTITGTGTYDYGSTITLTATPNEHYHFVRWSDGELSATRIIQVTENASYIAEFAIDQYTIIAYGENGVVTGAGVYEYGKQVVLTAMPNEHLHFVAWSDGEMASTRIITVTEDATYIAIFAYDEYTVTVTSINESMGTVSGGGTFEYGSEIALIATSEYGYEFTKWSDGNTDNPRMVTVTKNTQYVAMFAASQFSIIALSADELMGTVIGGGEYAYDTQATITAIANIGYIFNTWNDGNTDNPRMVQVTGDITLIATFVPSTDLQGVNSERERSKKVILDNHIYILRNGKTYTIEGQEVK